MAQITEQIANFAKSYWNFWNGQADVYASKNANAPSSLLLKAGIWTAHIAIAAIAISVLGNMAVPPEEPIATQPETTPQPEAIAPSPSVPVATPQASPMRDWKSYLPAADPSLRAKYEADSFLSGWLSGQSTWIGKADADDLVKRGFFVNAGWKFTGAGLDPDGENRGSCSALDFNGGFICGRGLSGPDWGVQSEEAIEHFIRYMH